MHTHNVFYRLHICSHIDILRFQQPTRKYGHAIMSSVAQNYLHPQDGNIFKNLSKLGIETCILHVQGGTWLHFPKLTFFLPKKTAQKGKARLPTSMFPSSFKEVSGKVICAMVLTPFAGDGHPTLNRKSLSWAHKPLLLG